MFRRSLCVASLLLGVVAGSASAQEPAALWPGLLQLDAAKAYRAMRQLAATPDRTVAFLGDTVPAPQRTATDKQIAELIRQLDSDQFAERDKAQHELERLDWQALPMLRKAGQAGSTLELKRRLEQLIARAEGPVSGANLRLHRAVEVVEWIGTADAKTLLERWSGGAAPSPLTQAATRALRRWHAHSRVEFPDGHRRVDALGDPLPSGAVLRLGSTRWRRGRGVIGNENDGILFSADGKRLLIAASNSIEILDAATGKSLLRRSFVGHISGMRLSPGGRRLLFSGMIYGDNMRMPFLNVWDATSLKDVASWSIDGAIVGFADGGKHAVLATAKGLRRVDPASGQEVSFTPVVKGMEGTVRAFNGTTVAGIVGRRLCVFDLVAPEKIRHLDMPDRNPRSMALSGDGKYLAIGGEYDYGVLIYDLARGAPMRYISGKDRRRDFVIGLAIAPDAKTLAFCSGQDQPVLVLWDLQTHRPRWKVSASAGQLAFSPDGKRIAGNSGWRTRVWDAATGKELSKSDPMDAHDSLGFGADGHTLIAVHSNTVRLLDFPSGKERVRVTHPKVYRAALAPDGRHLATSGFNDGLRLWDARSGREMAKLPDRGSQSGYAREFVFTSDSRRLCTWEADFRLLVWDVRTGRLLADHRPRPDGFPKFDPDDDKSDRRGFLEKGIEPGWCFAADGSRLFWDFKKLRTYDTATGRVLRTYDPPLEIGFYHVQVSNDGDWLLTGGADRGMTIFNLRQGKIAGHLPQPAGTFSSAFALAPDGRMFAVGVGLGAYHRITVVETATMQPRLAIPLEYSQPLEVSFSPDGRFLAVRMADRSAVIFDLRAPRI